MARGSTKYPGVRFREHKTRRVGPQADRYYSIRYSASDREVEEGLGWSSEGWSPAKASKIRSEIRENIKLGSGPQSLSEKRKIEEQQRRDARLEQEQRDRENVSFESAAEKFLEWARDNKTSWAEDAARLRAHVLPVLGQFRLADISAADVRNLQDACNQKGLSVSSVRHCMQLVKVIFNYAIRTGKWYGANPTEQVKFPIPKNRRLRFLTKEEAGKLIDDLQTRSELWHDITLLSLHTGMRRGEMFGLQWQDINQDHQIISIRDAKGGLDRQAYMTAEVAAMFRRRREWVEARFVFPSAEGGRLKSTGRPFKNAVAELKFNEHVTDSRHKVVFHTLRHTFASWLAIAGTPILTIKELMGHKTLEMTMRYAHLIPDQKREAVGKVFG